MNMPEARVRLAYVNLFARNIELLSGFYMALFGFGEIIGHRSPIYRCIDAGGIELGFNAGKAYELLELSRRRPVPGPEPAAVTAYFTFEADGVEAVDALVQRAAELGGSIIKPQYTTYYNAYQVVLARVPVSADYFK
jgi:predicted enzyme related to lactoylglutathione lyase